MRSINLADGWQVRQCRGAHAAAEVIEDNADWLPARVPGTVHEALLAAERIPDPFYGLNENAVQWIGESGWLYRCAFELPAADIEPAFLCFDGLDTIATVWLNGEQILRSDNMFVPQRVPVDGFLRAGANELRIFFDSALRHGQAQEAEHGRRAAWNGDQSRVYVRKAQYHYGWDWGPCLLTAGPWRPVRLEFGPRIADFHCDAEVAADLSSAALSLKVAVEGAEAPMSLRMDVFAPDGAHLHLLVHQAAPLVDAGDEIFVAAPALWWPRGYGEQARYRVVATLLIGERELDRRELLVGLRRLRLVQEPLIEEPGATFLFEINNTPIFCGGANWIPADSLTTRIDAATYRRWIERAADLGMVMLRVWGGGIYEDDVFYDLCDELGLLVWQDFMFACGIYPAHPEFQASVRAEAAAQIRRLRNHPSLALWCGNNEDYAIAHSNKLYDPSFGGDFAATAFPARAIYERLLPEVCAALDPSRPYWPGSPYNPGGVDDFTSGDRHTWEVWHGAVAPYQDYPKYEGRFVSEFGMEACPDLATIASFAPPEERYPQSRTLDHHNKSTDGPRRLAVYLNDTLRVGDTLEEYIYATQFVQAEALAAAYRGWRRRWAGPGRYAVAGALVWQLNDCWPVTSWAIVDYALRSKPAAFAIRRELAPLALGLARTPTGAALWAINGTTAPAEVAIELRGYDLDGAEVLTERWSGAAAANQASEWAAISHPALVPAAPLVLAARLGVVGLAEIDWVARATLWPEPFKYHAWPDPGLAIERLGADRLRISVRRPAKGVWLDAGDGVAWSDNMLDLLPGDSQTIRAAGLGGRAVRARWLGSGEASATLPPSAEE